MDMNNMGMEVIKSSNNQRLSNEVWSNIFRNLEEAMEEVEVVWLDSGDEWCLCSDCELFEDGFKTEKEAYERLRQLLVDVII